MRWNIYKNSTLNSYKVSPIGHAPFKFEVAILRIKGVKVDRELVIINTRTFTEDPVNHFSMRKGVNNHHQNTSTC